MPPGSRIDPRYGSKCLPTFGPDSNTPTYERKIGEHASPVRADINTWRSSHPSPTVNSPPAVKGRPSPTDDRYSHWCDFWGTEPNAVGLGVPNTKPDLSPTKDLVERLKVKDEERQLRHDIDEDERWFKNHNNKKPEKVEIREQARRSCSVLELSRLATGEMDGRLKRNFNRFGSLHQATRPRRLEFFSSPNKVWTPRQRPKTPAPANLRTRSGEEYQVPMPGKEDRDPSNQHRSCYVKHHAFGFLSEKNLHVREKKASAEYDRFSNFKDDKRQHSRKKFHAKRGYVTPMSTSMEIGWDSCDKETYVPICGVSPAAHDHEVGLPRVPLAGGLPKRLNSTMSKFVDNVLMTRPGFNPY